MKYEMQFEEKLNQVITVSATPAEYELSRSEQVVEQIIRPTGLLDPKVEVRPIEGQVDDLLSEIRRTVERGDKTLVTTLTTKMAEDLTDYLAAAGMKLGTCAIGSMPDTAGLARELKLTKSESVLLTHSVGIPE